MWIEKSKIEIVHQFMNMLNITKQKYQLEALLEGLKK